MRRESFEDAEIAALLNERFVCVKVDREERPDVDSVYMSACQLAIGQGGWPLTVVMTPDRLPFFTATYIPKEAMYGRTGLISLLPRIAALWKKDRAALVESGEKLSGMLRAEKKRIGKPDRELCRKGAGLLTGGFDPRYGGFGGAPKFPAPHKLLFLLRYSARENDERALPTAEKTLEAMYRGGIFDHIGGGFSRYATDRMWLIPHFEKMLYDNALLAYTYAEAYQATRRELYRTAAEKTLSYALRELSDPCGGFYCGQDADSEGVEGKYYLLNLQDVREALGERDAEGFAAHFGFTARGNFEGKNIPNLIQNPQFERADPRIEELCRIVYAYRKKRVPPATDDKILPSWNGLMIAALAKAYLAFGAPKYLSAAERAVDFLLRTMVRGDGRLLARRPDGKAGILGRLEDYAFLCWGLLELHQATLHVRYLDRAVSLAGDMLRLFSDKDGEGLFLYADDAEQLISLPKETYDGATPSGNSVAALVLHTLGRLTGAQNFIDSARKQLAFVSGAAAEYPSGHCFALIAVMDALYPAKELLCAGETPAALNPLFALLGNAYLPGLTVLGKHAGNEGPLSAVAPFTRHYPIPEGKAAYYLCENGACLAPVWLIEDLKGLLGISAKG